MTAFWSIDIGWYWIWLALLPVLVLLPAFAWRGKRLSYLTCLCSLLIVALAFLWIRNRTHMEGCGLIFVNHNAVKLAESKIGLVSGSDGIFLGYIQSSGSSYAVGTVELEYIRHPNQSRYTPVSSRFARWGFQWVNFTDPAGPAGPMPWDVMVLRIPVWFLMGLLSLPIAIKVRGTLRQRKAQRWQREGRCVCGYNLTGTPANPDASKRCSECGRVNRATQPQRVASNHAVEGTAVPRAKGESTGTAAHTQDKS